jgi:hypothetical protein
MRAALIATLLATVPACFLGEDDPFGEEAALAPSPVYWITGTLTISTEVSGPGTTPDAGELARRLPFDPADTLFTLARRAEVPAVETLDALPPALETRLLAAIDAHVEGRLRDDAATAAALDAALATVRAARETVALTTELVVAGGSAQHRLLALGFDVGDATASLDVAGAPGATVATTASVFGYGSESSLTLGAQIFGLPFATHALHAVDGALVRRGGGDLRAVIGDAIACEALALAVADECVMDECIGHPAELLALCEAALDRLVDELGSRHADAAPGTLLLGSSGMRMFDRDGDGIGEELAGNWQARLDRGDGPRRAWGPFASMPAP